VRIGAHNSIAGGLHNAVTQCQEIGGETMQIFCKNQRQWNAKPLELEAIEQFTSAVKAAGIGPVMVHDSYLINMGSPDDEKRERARQAFMGELERCEPLGIAYLNFHPGSHTHPSKPKRDDRETRFEALDRIGVCMNQCIEETKGWNTKLVIENAAGQGTNVGSNWEEVGYLADQVHDQSRVGICVDTQHSWACGYDWVDHYDEVWDDFDSQIGLNRLVAFHLNDSKQPLGARVDRHDNIPTGLMGETFWANLMQDTRFKDLDGYLETPLDNEDTSTWANEITYLKGLRDA
jgi:deoxyribonuclease-4